MVTFRIGETAGDIWHTLDREGPLRLSALKRLVDAEEAILLMAVGWLAREDKLEIEPAGRTYQVRLK